MKPTYDKQQYTATGSKKADVETYVMQSFPQNRHYIYSNTMLSPPLPSKFPHLDYSSALATHLDSAGCPPPLSVPRSALIPDLKLQSWKIPCSPTQSVTC